MDEELAASLRRLLADEPGATAEDLADVLWIARFVGGAQRPGAVSADEDAPPGRGSRPPAAGPTVAAPLAGPGPQDTPLHAVVPPRREDAAPGTGHSAPESAAVPVRVDRERPLAEMRALARALRPLKRVRSSGQRQLDEEATARATGETALLLPVLKAGQERHFEVDLVIDTGPSMVIWRQLASELRLLLEGHGAFRVVRTLCLDTVDGSPRFSWPGGRGIAPERLADPTGRRLILLLTDGIGPHWDSPLLDTVLHRWSRTQPVAVLQVLPHRLWHRTRLTTEPVSARPVAPGSAVPLYRARPHGGRTHGWVPVLELEPDWLEPWANVVAGAADGWTPLLALPVGRGASERQPRQCAESADSAEKLVERFRGEASVGAFELAGYLAAAPLVPPVMHLVQRAMMPRSSSAYLAEVFLSGLIVPAQEDVDDPDLMLYDFLPGVREALLGTLTRRESLRVLDVIGRVSGKVAQRFGGSLSFRALVPSAEADGEWRIPAGSAPFARVAAGVLAGLGAEHRALAEALTSAATAPPVENLAAPPMDDDGGGEGRSREDRVIDLACAATVSVHPSLAGNPQTGSGFFVAPGWVLTTAEVVTGGRRSRVLIGHAGRLIPGAVEWTQPEARYGGVSVSGLALVRLLQPVDHSCVWLSERTTEFQPAEVAYAGSIDHRGRSLEVSGRCAVQGKVGSGGVLILEQGAAPEQTAIGGPVVDLDRGEVIGVLGGRRRSEKADLVVPVTELRRESGELYQEVVCAHDNHHTGTGHWGEVLSDIGNAGRVLTPHERIELLGLLAQLPPPESTASLERLVRSLGGKRWYTLAPRAWRDGLGLLYDIPGVGGLEAVLRYAVWVATEERDARGTGKVERRLWDWARDIAERGLPEAFRRMLAEERRGRLRVPEPQRSVLLEIFVLGWERDSCGWRISVTDGGERSVLFNDGRAPLANLHTYVAAPLAEAFRRCDEPDRPATLEVALPEGLLGLHVDAWRLDRFGVTVLGATRPVIVRCADRASWLDEERHERWLTLHRREPALTVLDPVHPDAAALRSLPLDALPVLCGNSPSALRVLIAVGHPIALWQRAELTSEASVDAFRRGVERAMESMATAAELPDRVFALRRDLAADRLEAYWAHGLTLMYDDPTSPLPGHDVILEAP